MPVHESDICVIGGGITAVMLIERLAELKPNLKITAVEAGRSIFDRENRSTYHRRALSTVSIRGTVTTSRISRPRA